MGDCIQIRLCFGASLAAPVGHILCRLQPPQYLTDHKYVGSLYIRVRQMYMVCVKQGAVNAHKIMVMAII